MIEYLGEGAGVAKSGMPLSHAVRAGDFAFVSGQVPTEAF
jgi:enamine deaminase RidA (YjgF/YER057c/UK114 family)